MSDITYSSDEGSLAASRQASAGDYFALLKPRVMSLVLFTGLIGVVVAPGDIHPAMAVIALICIAVGAGASGAMNMWFDADIDAVMERTQQRPIPEGRIMPQEALTFGLFLSAASVFTMGLLVNLAAAGLLAFTIFFYVVIYTMWLKRLTVQNIVIGGAAGAFPPVIGWAAVTGGLELPAWTMFLLIFLWTPPHFWALALFRSGDYAKAGVPMLPVVRGEKSTRRQIVGYSFLMLAASFAPLFLGVGGMAYLVGAALLGAAFLFIAFMLLREQEGTYRWAGRLFGFSIFYLFALFSLLPFGPVLMQAG
ncbi:MULTISPECIES: heme o synthase [unclassified Minwuia]|uniref:heme o synthase n=1 Tax=unclassified Minwuia TaxID=2618799 RepID=UPI002478581B|nr:MULTISPECIES: heme o synthase [unclassified Minwuia]